MGKELMFGQYRVSTGILAMGTKYRVEERVLPLVPRLYACGRLADQGGAITTPAWRSLILSNKTREELLTSATKIARFAFYGGGGAAALGILFAVIGAFVDPPPSPPVAKAASPAATASSEPEPVASTSPTPAPPSSKVGSTRTTSAAVVPAKTGSDAGAPKAAPLDAGTKPSSADAGVKKKSARHAAQPSHWIPPNHAAPTTNCRTMVSRARFALPFQT